VLSAVALLYLLTSAKQGLEFTWLLQRLPFHINLKSFHPVPKWTNFVGFLITISLNLHVNFESINY
jgi:hypothetical protein